MLDQNLYTGSKINGNLKGSLLFYLSQDLPLEPHVKMRLLINKEIKTTTMMAVQMMGPTTERRPTKPNQPANNQVCNLY